MRCVTFTAAIDTREEIRVEVHGEYLDTISLFIGGHDVHLILTTEAAGAIVEQLRDAIDNAAKLAETGERL